MKRIVTVTLSAGVIMAGALGLASCDNDKPAEPTKTEQPATKNAPEQEAETLWRAPGDWGPWDGEGLEQGPTNDLDSLWKTPDDLFKSD